MRIPRFAARLRLRHIPATAFALLLAVAWSEGALAQSNDSLVPLAGQVLDVLPQATKLPRNAAAAEEPLILTIMLNWSDPAGFAAYQQAFHDPASRDYRHALAGSEITARFGPSQAAYDAMLAYLQGNGLTLLAGSDNRLTLSVRGTRAQAERAFHVHIDEYQLGGRTFHAPSEDPTLPATLAASVRAVLGLDNLAEPRPGASPSPSTARSIATAYNSAGVPASLDGTGQNIALIEFDSYLTADVQAWLNLVGLPPATINQISNVAVDGGTPPSGCNPLAAQCGTAEVLTDIAAVLMVAPRANVVIFISPKNAFASFTVHLADTLNAALQATQFRNGVVSLSWSACESEISNSDADAFESLLQVYETSGVSIFMASGDTGSSCVSSANRVSFPAGAPHAIAVGGTILQVGAGNSYQSETWWNNTQGAGGFGVSQHFPKPVWQNAFAGSSVTGRSVPDVVADAGQDIQICATFQNLQSCNIFVGGTSISAPFWAASWALVNQARLTAVSGAGGFLYNWSWVCCAFHSAGGLSGPGNDFAHVGLGSPDLTRLIADIAGSPSIAGMTPGEATVLGGTRVTISGRNFIGVQSVTFPGGPTASPIVAAGSDQSITALTPQLTYSLTGPVVIKTVAGQSAIGPSSRFVFGPSISNVQPSHGPTFGQTQVGP
jgi:kumamolisin